MASMEVEDSADGQWWNHYNILDPKLLGFLLTKFGGKSSMWLKRFRKKIMGEQLQMVEGCICKECGKLSEIFGKTVEEVQCGSE